jgi:hypothetical protein
MKKNLTKVMLLSAACFVTSITTFAQTTQSTETNNQYWGNAGQTGFAFDDNNGAISLLPVQFATFTAQAAPEYQMVELAWETVSEVNNSHFNVLKSTDGKEWDFLARIQGAGNSYNKQTYVFLDMEPAKLNYYRLEQVDFDGAMTLSDIRTVLFSKPDKLNKPVVNVYPIPSAESVNIQIDTDDEAFYRVFDMQGKLIQEGQMKGRAKLEGIPQGIYNLLIVLDAEVSTFRIILN